MIYTKSNYIHVSYKRNYLLILVFIFGLCWTGLGLGQKIPVSAGTESDVNLYQPKESDSFTVALIADRTGGSPEDLVFSRTPEDIRTSWRLPKGLQVLHRAVYEINQVDPDFVIHIGDMVEGYTRDVNLWMQEYKEFQSVMDKLEVPWYPTPGNHDVISGSRDPNDSRFEKLYQKHFGPLYYSFDYKNSHFICLYTDEALQSKVYFSDAQIQWLKNDLENTNKTNIFVYMHKPAWDEYYSESGWERIHEILKEHPVRAVIAGHYHSYRKCPSKDGIQYYILGATGGNLYEKVELAGQFNHYNILQVNDDSFTMGVVKLGNVESDDYVVQEDAERIRKLVTQRDETRVDGWLWQPITDEVTGTVHIRIANPLDTEIPVELHFNDEFHWVLISALRKLVLAPKSSVSVDVKLHSPIVAPEDIVPPKFTVEYIYTNQKNKIAEVPVKLWIPLRASYEIFQRPTEIDIDGRFNEPNWQDAKVFHTKSWLPSPYEREDEPTPMIHIMADGSYLYFCVMVPDEVYEYYREGNRTLRGLRADRLLSDYIVFAAGNEDESRAVLIFPFNDKHQAFRSNFPYTKPSELKLIQGVQYATSKNPDKKLYICEGKIAYDKLFGTKDVAGGEFLFNAAVVDNDKSAFTYLKSWTYAEDRKYWGIVRFVTE